MIGNIEEKRRDHHDYCTTSAASSMVVVLAAAAAVKYWLTHTYKNNQAMLFTTLSHHGIDHQFRRSSSTVECHGHNRET